jgi:hypothetical protein
MARKYNVPWNYEQYTKAIVPLALGVGRFFQGWVESGALSRSELSDVIGLVVVAFLVFLVPNQKKVEEPEAPVESMRRRR